MLRVSLNSLEAYAMVYTVLLEAIDGKITMSKGKYVGTVGVKFDKVRKREC